MENTQDTLRVCFVPARNPARSARDGSDVICRLPSGKVAFPSRQYWNQPPPQPYELWLVRPCGETARVGYVKPIQRLAEAPFRDTSAGRFGNSLLWRLGRFLAALIGLVQRPHRGAHLNADARHGDPHGVHNADSPLPH